MAQRWKQIQSANMNSAFSGQNSDVSVSQVFTGRVNGFLYRGPRSGSRGILMVGGFPGGKHYYNQFCSRLADYGFIVLSIDIPSISGNTEQYSLGAISEVVTQSVGFLKQNGAARIGVVGHSTGAIGSIFANSGYTRQIEVEIYRLWENICSSVEKLGRGIVNMDQDLNKLSAKLEEDYTRMKQIILFSLKQGISYHGTVSCYVLIAPPASVKNCVPGLTILRSLKIPWVKKVFDTLFFKKDKSFKIQDFKTADVYEFLNYFLNMKESTDFLSLVEAVANFRNRDNRTTFFKYYLEKYVRAKPKLIIYGKYDGFLRPFLFWNSSRLEKFYSSLKSADLISQGRGGTVQVMKMDFDHLFTQNFGMNQSQILTSTKAGAEIIRFLDANL